MKCETIVRGDEVNRAEWPAWAVDDIARTRKSGGQFCYSVSVIAAVSRISHIAQPKSANAVTVAVVPLAEAIRKPSGLPTAEADIPGFDNHF